MKPTVLKQAAAALRWHPGSCNNLISFWRQSATLSDRNSIYVLFFFSFLPSSLPLALGFFLLRILIYISRYCLSRSWAVRENKTRTVKNLIFPKADSCWRGSIGGKVFEVCSVTPHIKSSLHHASSSRNKAHTKLAEQSAPPRMPALTLSFNSSCFNFTSSLSVFCPVCHHPFCFYIFGSLFFIPQISISFFFINRLQFHRFSLL